MSNIIVIVSSIIYNKTTRVSTVMRSETSRTTTPYPTPPPAPAAAQADYGSATNTYTIAKYTAHIAHDNSKPMYINDPVAIITHRGLN